MHGIPKARGTSGGVRQGVGRPVLSAVALTGCVLVGSVATALAQSPDPQASGAPPSGRIRVAGTIGAGFTDSPIRAAVDKLAAQGYEAEMVETADSALNIEGLSQGQFDITAGDTGGSLIGIQQAGAPIAAIAAGPANAWTVYSTSDITTCADLAGRRVAIHGQVSDSTAMLTNYINSECPGTTPEYVVIAGSPNRLAALLAGEVDATPLELSDAIVLEDEPDGRFALLTSFAETLPDLRPTWAVANRDFLTNRPDLAQAWLKAIVTEFRMIDDDPAYLRQLLTEYGPELVEQPSFESAVQRYVELGIFDRDYGAEESMFDYTIGFYEDSGSIQPGLTVDQVVDLGPLNAVLDELGREEQ
jgi:NitT/TauT family transport system substrate-binding protein